MTVLIFGLKALLGLILWMFVSLIAFVCEIKWGFPFFYGSIFKERGRKFIAKARLAQNTFRHIVAGPIMFLLMALALLWAAAMCLFARICQASRYIFGLPAK